MEQGPWHEVPYLKAADGTGSLRRRDACKPFEASSLMASIGTVFKATKELAETNTWVS